MVIIYSALFWLFSFSVHIQGKILGGGHTIDKPPLIGKTKIQLLNNEGKQLWKSEEIVFNPNKNLDAKGRPLSVVAMPDSGHYVRTPDQRIRIYLDYKKMREEGKTNIFNLLGDKYNLDSRTVKNYVEECSNLTDLEKYLEKHPID